MKLFFEIKNTIRTEFNDDDCDRCVLEQYECYSDGIIYLGKEKGRMRLDQEHVKNLLPYLVEFAKTGELKELDEDTHFKIVRSLLEL